MSGYGTGSPNFFRCSHCRSSKRRGWENTGTGRASRVKLTGKSRLRNTNYARNGILLLQYQCQDCGHTGWSSHKDLAQFGQKAS